MDEVLPALDELLARRFPIRPRGTRLWSMKPLLAKMYDCPVCGEVSKPPDNYGGPEHVSTNRAWTSGDRARPWGKPCNILTHVADRLGISHRRIYQYVANGITDRRAEEFAFAMGLFPHEVWGREWFERALDHPAYEGLTTEEIFAGAYRRERVAA